MRLALALAIATSWCASASPSTVGVPASDAEARPEVPSASTMGEHEAEARLLLAAANIVGGLWHAADSADDPRGLELVIWGLRVGTKGTALAPEMPLSHLANLHFDHGNFARSLDYQRAWLRDSDWVVRACPEVCALPDPGRS